ncbi:MAG: hypothetical protein HGA99_00590 [Chlorobiaceae bacterium]|nr:hypothetical protein [Chlorobiaceae bacterium]
MRLLFSIAIIVLWPMVAEAEWKSKASISGSAESNVFRNSSPEKDLVTEAEISVAHAWDWEKWSAMASFEGSSINFTDHADRNYILPQITLAVQRNLENKGWIRSGVRAKTRIDGDNYQLYDYQEYAGFVDTKLPRNDHLTLLTGYSLHNRRYDQFEEMDNLEHQLYGGLQIAMEGGRNIAFLSELGYRHYLSPLSAGTTVVRQGYRGRRIVTTGSSKESANAGQWVNSLTLSSPVIDDRTGVRLYAKYRVNFGGSNLPVNGLSADNFSTDDLFDDRYSYESREFGGMLSRTLPYAVTVRTGYDQAVKNYTETAQDSSGNAVAGSPERGDDYKRIWVRLEKSLSFSGKDRQLRLYGEYQKIWNSSNDVFNQYNATSTTAGVELLF